MGYNNTVDFDIEMPDDQQAKVVYDTILSEVDAYDNHDPNCSNSHISLTGPHISGFMFDYNEENYDTLRAICLKHWATVTFKKRSDWDGPADEVEFAGPGADKKRREYARKNLLYYCKEFLKEVEGDELTTFVVKTFMTMIEKEKKT